MLPVEIIILSTILPLVAKIDSQRQSLRKKTH